MATQEIATGATLYDLNKEIMKKQKPMSNFAINNAKVEIILNWLHNEVYINHFYFMLLCNERKDYTIFKVNEDSNPNEMVDILIECFTNRELEFCSINPDENNTAIEFWVREGEEIYCYYFFPYDEGVIEI